MKVTVLIENTCETPLEGLQKEHGLSLWIEQAGTKLILDTGSSGAFVENARLLGIDLTEAECVLISHAHYDHTGGIGAYFKECPEGKVVARKEIQDLFYSGDRFIGAPTMAFMNSSRFFYVEKTVKLQEIFFLISHKPDHLAPIGERNHLYKMQEGSLVPDDFLHEITVAVKTEKGLVIFSSCCHSGLKNTLQEVRQIFTRPIYAFVGGLHLKGKDEQGREICTYSDSELDEMAAAIRREKIQKVYIGHCTGAVGFAKLKERLGDIVEPLTTGLTFEL